MHVELQFLLSCAIGNLQRTLVTVCMYSSQLSFIVFSNNSHVNPHDDQFTNMYLINIMLLCSGRCIKTSPIFMREVNYAGPPRKWRSCVRIYRQQRMMIYGKLSVHKFSNERMRDWTSKHRLMRMTEIWTICVWMLQ